MRLNQNLTDSSSEIQNPSSSRFNDIDGREESSSNNREEENENGVVKGVSDQNEVEKVRIENAKSKLLGESVLMNKLENWVDQYKKDIEDWGIGSGPIFTVYQDSSGNVKEVSVDEGEILRRNQVEQGEIEEFPEVNNKILSAKSIAREMENGNNVIPKNSSVAKFVVQGKETGFLNTIRGFTVQPTSFPKLSGIGGRILCVLVILWAVKKLFAFGDKETQYTEIEKEMMRRKIKSRKEKEALNGVVDVIPVPSKPPIIQNEKPKLDKDILKNNILKAKASVDQLVAQNSLTKETARSMDMDTRVQEIKDMARKAREIEGNNHSLGSKAREMENSVIGETSNELEIVNKHSEQDASLGNHLNDVMRQTVDINATPETSSVDIAENIDNSLPQVAAPVDGSNRQASNVSDSDDKKIKKQKIELTESTVHPKDNEVGQLPDTPFDDSSMTRGSFTNKKPRIIRSVKEAKDYLSKKHDKQEAGIEHRIQLPKDDITDLRSPSDVDNENQKSQMLEMNIALPRNNDLDGTLDSKLGINDVEDSSQKNKEFGHMKNGYLRDSQVEHEVGDPQNSGTSLDHDLDTKSDSKHALNVVEDSSQKDKEFNLMNNDYLRGSLVEHDIGDPLNSGTSLDHDIDRTFDSKPTLNDVEDSSQKDNEFDLMNNGHLRGSLVEHEVGDPQSSGTSLDHEVNGGSTEKNQSAKTENWLEKNFDEVEPIIKKIRAGFRDNYMVAKDRVDQPLDITTEVDPIEDGGELDWMQNEYLRDIVFKVRDNELAGRDPFYLIDAEDKEAFFRGLEEKVEKENKRLSYLHEWLHSNIENLDYGAGNCLFSNKIYK